MSSFSFAVIGLVFIVGLACEGRWVAAFLWSIALVDAVADRVSGAKRILRRLDPVSFKPFLVVRLGLGQRCGLGRLVGLRFGTVILIKRDMWLAPADTLVCFTEIWIDVAPVRSCHHSRRPATPLDRLEQRPERHQNQLSCHLRPISRNAAT